MKRLFLALCLFMTSLGAIAQPTSERLSAWLLRQTAPLEYPMGLQWQVPQEREEQGRLKQALLDRLAKKSNTQGLSDWVEQQAATGRVIVSSSDARWLEANPAHDPVIAADQTIKLIPRPMTVTILMPNGTLCQPQHTAGATAKSYTDACAQGQNHPRAWIAQPDGRVSNYGIANWNAESQPELAPGAWIWAPDPDLDFSEAFSDGLIRFLASLGAAADASQWMSPRVPVPVQDDLKRRPAVSTNDWGEIGLIQTPSARMANVSGVRVSISKALPYTRSNVMLQPTDWLEAGFRYTDIGNRAYDDSGALQTSQTFKDKSFDFKLRLREESSLAPAIAMGMRDIGGTGLFSSEYFVASKRFGDLDASVGIGWGYMASSGNLSNPLGKLNTGFYTRPSASTATGGEVGTKALFRGPAGLFGGVQWRASDTLTYKIEREANDYQNEPLANPLVQRSFWNFAANYRYSPTVDLVVGVERGNKLMAGLSIQTNLDGQSTPKLLNAAPIQYQAVATAPAPALNNFQALSAAVNVQTGWSLVNLDETGSAWRVQISMGTGAGANSHRDERLQRVNALIQSMAPVGVLRWQLTFMERGLSVHAVEVDRAAWAQSQAEFAPLVLRREVALAYAPPLSAPVAATTAAERPQAKTPDFTVRLGPSYNHVLGGPDAFWLYRIGAELSASYQVNPSTWIDGSIDFRMLDNMGGFKFTGPSNLPRVRTNLREYTVTSRVTMPSFQATHVSALGQDHFGSAYAGYLESMFAGIGAEWLYRPWQSRLAVGADVNLVRQRNFEQNFGLRDYQVGTGHVTAYWDTGFANTLAKLQVGRYLAGDVGATLDFSRRFSNGASMGVYATKTNVSAQQFGEGSFDKGIYFSLPFDVMLPKYTDRSATIAWQPLTRDGGARLQRQQQLYNITAGRDRQAFDYASSEPAAQAQSALAKELTAYHVPESMKADRGEDSVFSTVGPTVVRSAVQTAKELTHPDSIKPWAWGMGLVLASSTLDNKANNWALNHAGAGRIAKMGNSVPLLLGLSALADLGERGVGWTALQSAGLAYAANTALRVSVGRARPTEELGSHHFDVFTAQGLKSSFASNHTAVAFALATPFAQTYDMPWLYGVAGVTALGRVQARNHWLSDTVAGGVLGYAIGSVMTDQHSKIAEQNTSGRQLLLLPHGLAAKWWW